jgi:hypothetical protein
MTNLTWTMRDGNQWRAIALRGEQEAIELYIVSAGDRPVETLRAHAEFLLRNLETVEQRIESFIHGATIPMTNGVNDFSILHDKRCPPIILSITIDDPSQPTHAYVEFITHYPDVYCLYTAELNLLSPIGIRGEMW